MTRAEIDAKLGEIRKLKDGWDSYGGKAPTALAVDIAELVTTPPEEIAPTNDGGIVLAWETGIDFLELRISPDGTATLYFEALEEE